MIDTSQGFFKEGWKKRDMPQQVAGGIGLGVGGG